MSAPLSEDERAELDRLRAQVADLERQRAELVARTNALVGRAQARTYWLDRWGLDLNALMERPGAAEAREGVRRLRGVYRGLLNLKRRLA